jgi:phosphoadenosine phosphosulfate reductase
MGNTLEEVGLTQAEAESSSAAELVSFALERFSPRVAIASSFSAEDVVLIHLAAQAGRDFRVFTLDTDFLFRETYALIDNIERRYNIKVERTKPRLSPEEQAAEFGEALWNRHPDRCCNLRKVEPLTQKLSELDAWVTGIRRDQAPTRAKAPKLERDAKFGLIKFNPLADWKWEQVWDYIRSHDIPYNPLHDQGYPSIGCTYCTRPVQEGEDLRAGRWSGFAKTECGLHPAGGRQ